MTETPKTAAEETEEGQSRLAHHVMAECLKVGASFAIPDMEMADACLSGAFTLVRRHARSDTEAVAVLLRALNKAMS